MKFGDWVDYAVDGCHRGSGYVIGVPHYSKGYGDVVMLAADHFHGMPISAKWCKPTGQSDEGAANLLALRYCDLYPDFLLARKDA